MKTKNILLVGSGALILYLLMKQKKNTNFQSNLTNSDTNSAGASASSPILPSQNTSNEPEQVYGCFNRAWGECNSGWENEDYSVWC